MKRVIVFFLLFLPCLSFAQAHLNGTILTLADGSRISAGSQVKILKPSKGSRFSFIYSELALRASSEDDLPYGVSSSLANQEVTVKRFLERKGNSGNKFYLICTGSFIKNAIDIENAIKTGEVSVANSAAATPSRPGLASNTYGQAQNPASSFGKPPGSVLPPISLQTPAPGPRLIRRPWDPLVIPVAKDTVAIKDSSKRFVKAFKSVDSINNMAKGIRSDSSLKVSKARDSATTTVKEKKSISSEPVLNAIAKPKHSESHTEEAAAEAVTGPPDSEHSVSALMTLPSAESLKPKEVPVNTPALESGSGYTKFGKLKQLKELFDSGVLTKAEFDAEKKKILSGQ